MPFRPVGFIDWGLGVVEFQFVFGGQTQLKANWGLAGKPSCYCFSRRLSNRRELTFNLWLNTLCL